MKKLFAFISIIISLVGNRFTGSTKKRATVGGRKKEIYSRVVSKISGERFSTPGISELAIVVQSAKIATSATISPGVYIGHNVKIGERTRVYPNASILDDTVVGNDVIVGSGSVLGGEGYGYYLEKETKDIKLVPQIGKVVIEDKVHIGSNVSIDRAAIGNTLIGRGSKLNNNVHVAHNVQIGKHCLIMAGASISGSTQIGDYVVINPQVAISKHVVIGEKSEIGMNSTVIRDVLPNTSPR